MTLTKAVLTVTPSLSVSGGTQITLDGSSSSTAADNTTLTGPDAYLFEQVSGPIVSLKATPTHEGANPIDSVQFNTPPGSSQLVTLGPGDYSVTEMIGFGFIPIFSGDCMQTASGSFTATGTISAGEHQTCTIINNQRPG